MAKTILEIPVHDSIAETVQVFRTDEGRWRVQLTLEHFAEEDTWVEISAEDAAVLAEFLTPVKPTGLPYHPPGVRGGGIQVQPPTTTYNIGGDHQ